MSCPDQIQQLVLKLTGACNFACRYCYAAKQLTTPLDPSIAIQTLDYFAARRSTPLTVQFTGGEPLLNFACLQAVVQHAEKNRLPVRWQLQTNATRIDAAIAAFCRQHRIAIGVSLDGIPAINDLQRKAENLPSSSQATLAGIFCLKEAQIDIGLTCVLTAENVAALPQFIEFAYYLGNIKKIGFDLLRPQGNGQALQQPPVALLYQQLLAAYRKSAALSKLTNYAISFTQQERLQHALRSGKANLSHCPALRQAAVFVDGDGQFYACASFIGDAALNIGDYQRGLDAAAFAQVKATMQKALTACLACALLPSCGGGCFARCQGGDFRTECTLHQATYAYLSENNLL